MKCKQEIKRAKRLSQALVHFGTAHASLFADHGMSGLPVRAKYRHSRQFESQLLTTLQQIRILLLWIDGHQSMELRHCEVVLLLSTFLCMTFQIIGPC